MKKPFIPQYELYEDMTLVIDQLTILNSRLIDKSDVSTEDINAYLKYWNNSITELHFIKQKLENKLKKELL